MSNDELEQYKKRIRGYFATDILVQEMLADAKQKLQPYENREGKSEEWWQGHYEGLLAAYYFMALGKFPDVPINAEKIKEMLEPEK
jgi:hypothetical protein